MIKKILFIVLLFSLYSSIGLNIYLLEINRGSNLKTIDLFNSKNLLTEEENVEVVKMACDSDSMGLMFNCGDKIIKRKLNETEKLKEGKVYTYLKGKSSIIHRLVFCSDENCTKAIFKGDNNRKAEIVGREQITHEVLGVNYG